MAQCRHHPWRRHRCVINTLVLGVACLELAQAELNLPPGSCLNPVNSSGKVACLPVAPAEGASPSAGRRLITQDIRPMTLPPERYEFMVQTEMVNWGGLNDAAGEFHGVLQTNLIWPAGSEQWFTEVHKVFDINNWVGGQIMPHPVLEVHLGNGTTYKHQLVRYLGSFKQSPDGSCYPFDRVTMEFQLAIPAPGSWVFDLVPLCTGAQMTPYNRAGDRLDDGFTGDVWRCVDTSMTGLTAAGFVWDEMVCERVPGGNAAITCTVVGARYYLKTLTAYLLPSVATSVMSFLSFKFSRKLAMPRVATTMIAMLTQINLKIAIYGMQPRTGSMSWLDFQLQVAFMLCLINLIGHVFALHFDSKGSELAAQCVDEFFFELGVCIAATTSLLYLFGQGCTEEINLPLAVVVLIVSSALGIWHLVNDVRKYWTPFLAWFYFVKDEAEDQGITSHLMDKPISVEIVRRSSFHPGSVPLGSEATLRKGLSMETQTGTGTSSMESHALPAAEAAKVAPEAPTPPDSAASPQPPEANTGTQYIEERVVV
eukprot:TRINITY_DN21623_c0_g1_i4.p1 TRINITY_DN21623_c0_g1~~TRINITY_DN21623_c0_g1_i4.p1  ORF type:complete len:539 (+),score=76.33 TRINITY_DN21623_c0_g1_i4:139-1755(+)